MDTHVGDTIEVQGIQVGQPTRRGVVKELMADDPLELRVEWDDGHESVFLPAGGMVRVIADSSG